jgi:four helix bundle protein
MEAKSKIKSYRDLLVWQKGMDLVAEVYRVTRRLPPHEGYGLSSQMQRAAVSIPSNIAEGFGRQHRREYLQHLAFSNGSLKEVETQALITVRLGYLKNEEIEALMQLADEVGRMLNGLMRKLRAVRPNP